METHVLLLPSLPSSICDSDVLSSLDGFLVTQDVFIFTFSFKNDPEN